MTVVDQNQTPDLERLDEVFQKLGELARKSLGGNYIYRG